MHSDGDCASHCCADCAIQSRRAKTRKEILVEESVAGDQPKKPNGPPAEGAPAQEQDPKRRLGDFTGAGEHSLKEPGRLNDGDVHNK